MANEFSGDAGFEWNPKIMVQQKDFRAWLDLNCDLKKHHIGPKPLPQLDGKPYECDYWYFVIDDFDGTEIPAIALRVGHELRSGYLEVTLENMDDSGNIDGSAFVGLFPDIESFESLTRLLVKINRH